jgi:hypothetical protein
VKSAKTCLILLLAATTLGGAALAWRQYGELVELRAAAMNRNERADLQKRVWDLEKENRELQDRLAAQREPSDVDELLAAATNPERPSSTRERGSRGDSRGRGSSGFQQAVAVRELMNKPEVQAMLNVQYKGAIEARYAALFKNLNLPPEQVDRLKNLLAERITTMQDVTIAAREQGINPRENPEAFRKVIADAQNQINNGIKAVIGEQGFAQLSNYEQTIPQRNVVNELQQRLSYTNTPLTPAQAEQMVQILATNPAQRQPGATTDSGRSGGPQPGGRGGPSPSFGFGPGRGPDVGGMMGGMMGSTPGLPGDGRGTAPVTSAAVAQAQTVLAPPQVAALQEIHQQQQTQQRLRQLVGETLSTNQPARAETGTGKSSGTAPGATTPPSSAAPSRRRGG